MKKSTRLRLLAIFLISFPALSFASGYSGVVTIKSLHLEGTSFAMVVFTSTATNPDACGNSTEAMILESASYYQSALALLMEAYATGSPIKLYLQGCGTTPWGYSIPEVWAIDVNP